MATYSILFVCMGNICRSPTAHGVFRQKVKQHRLSGTVAVDSAGTHDFHPNCPPDERSKAHATRRGYDLSDLKARQIQGADFETFDLIAVMDMDNLAQVQDECPPGAPVQSPSTDRVLHSVRQRRRARPLLRRCPGLRACA